MERSPTRVTLKDIARLAGVHPATASRALDPARGDMIRPETRDRVRRVAEEAGYYVNSFARSLRKNASGMVGVVVADVANPFLPPILRGIEQVVRAERKLLLIAETHEDSGTLLEIIDHFIAQRVDAVILSAARFGDEGAVASLAQKIPVVLAVRSVGSTRFPTITHDDVLGGKLAAEHLVGLGHRDLAQLRGPMDVSSFHGRAQGFAAVMATTTARERLVEQSATAPTVEEGRRLASAILDASGEHPTALFAHNDLMAVGALEALRERGLACPHDVSVIGYNDAPLSNHVNPPLTTVRLPSLDLGRRVATLALAEIAGPTIGPVIEKLPPELIIRESTSAPRRT